MSIEVTGSRGGRTRRYIIKTPKLPSLEKRDWVFDAVDIQSEQRAVEFLNDYRNAVLEAAAKVVEGFMDVDSSGRMAAEIRALKTDS